MPNEKCPVCEMDVKDSKITSKFKGKEYKFCCEGCKRKFDANPEQYIKK